MPVSRPPATGLKEEVKRCSWQNDGQDAGQLLPTMAEPARRRRPQGRRLRGRRRRRASVPAPKVHGLVPANFSRRAPGNLKVLVSYPAGSKDTQIERYLAAEIRLPKEAGTVMEFRPIKRRLHRGRAVPTSMSITEVPELREILHHWAEALGNEQSQDFLKWRQRLGYDYGGWRRQRRDRVRILHHLLCAMWNGAGEGARRRGRLPVHDPGVTRRRRGGGDDPRSHPVRAGVRRGAACCAPTRTGRWPTTSASAANFCEQLMRTQPDGVTGRLVDPHIVFQTFVDNAEKQAELLADMLTKLPVSNRGWVGQQHDFWATTVPAALDMHFENVATPVRANLRQLYEMVEARSGPPALRKEL
jgi:hypothetical protein